MVRCTAEERALARAAVYRLLALSCSYPTTEVRRALEQALPVAAVAGELLDEPVAEAVEAVRAAAEATPAGDWERAYQRVFTLTYSEDCPLYETAFSASQIFQQSSQAADIAGFFRAFGVQPHAERPDHLALELEFTYLLALKEARARERGEPEHVRISRDAQREFLRQHLARWSSLIGQRIALAGGTSVYGVAGLLLAAFIAYDERFLRLGTVERYRDEPVLIADDPGEMTCMLAEADGAGISDLPLYEHMEEAQRVTADIP